MGIHSFDVQKIVYSTLNGDSTLDGLVGNNKIFDNVPQDTTYPYVVIGTENTRDNGTKTVDGRIYNFDIEVYSQYRGQKEIKNIMERIYNLMHDVTLSVSGASNVMSRVITTSTFVEVDGITRQGSVNVEFTTFDS
ncbi:MAG: putative tail completion protein [Prokaryotic dsDNA virus sp.]|nr:MAG: putative tail completion protein [Prokaryotic dsDNA virus sp.]|tara:strand:- start:1232 stop:1639 length:408 start_codon:yes stop_codon:yes gene_type:complete